MAATTPPVPRTGPNESTATWRLSDRIMLGLCWACGIGLCVVAASILAYMAFKGVQYLRPELLVSRPTGDVDQSQSGGILDPIFGTMLITVLATVIAVPLGVAVTVWLVEYGRPKALARVVESSIEVIAGTPSIVLAIFGLIIFQQSFLGFLSFTAEGGGVFGRSVFNASCMMALIALPLVVGATREGLNAIPGHVREASYALGKTKGATIRRVLLPAVRPSIATGTALGMGRVAGDTAIVIILLGNTLLIEPEGDTPLANILRGTGSTLTSYVYENSPAGEGGAYEKAYAAAFVLLLVVLGLNVLVARIGARGKGNSLWNR
ncbi:MAG: phosphate ABC transporter permease PstA [Solirubrobacteraceae bacterium]|nr:phosphate ABC transporter permease PstA [Solirubrobacteraceae bacterium]